MREGSGGDDWKERMEEEEEDGVERGEPERQGKGCGGEEGRTEEGIGGGSGGGTGGVAAVEPAELPALPTCSGPLVIGYYFLIIIILFM